MAREIGLAVQFSVTWDLAINRRVEAERDHGKIRRRNVRLSGSAIGDAAGWEPVTGVCDE
jgi:hypothetical protein